MTDLQSFSHKYLVYLRRVKNYEKYENIKVCACEFQLTKELIGKLKKGIERSIIFSWKRR